MFGGTAVLGTPPRWRREPPGRGPNLNYTQPRKNGLTAILAYATVADEAIVAGCSAPRLFRFSTSQQALQLTYPYMLTEQIGQICPSDCSCRLPRSCSYPQLFVWSPPFGRRACNMLNGKFLALAATNRVSWLAGDSLPPTKENFRRSVHVLGLAVAIVEGRERGLAPIQRENGSTSTDTNDKAFSSTKPEEEE